MASKKPTSPTRTYVVTGRILRNGQVLRPANPAFEREADTVVLAEAEAASLRGFVKPAATTTNTETKPE